jgi:uncharacterized protein (DUF4415 family)
MTAQICNKCGECYEWSQRYKHKCQTNEPQVAKSLFVGSVKDFGIAINEKIIENELKKLRKEHEIKKKKGKSWNTRVNEAYENRRAMVWD